MINYREFKKLSRTALILCLAISGLLIMMNTGCSRSAPLNIDDLHVVMPGDDPNKYDVYRVIAVKQDVSKEELIDLMEYFVRLYIDKNRVRIYVFKSAASAHLGQTSGCVATYYQDMKKKEIRREILLDNPNMGPQPIDD